jgi:hypothetical protein
MTDETAARSDPGALLDRFMALYRGNERSSGRHDPGRDRAFTEPTPPATANFKDHLNGEMGVGVVPIMDDNSCWWAAIDIDNHDSDEDLPIAAVDAIIRDKGLPLIACRSKSGGIHCYVFCAEPLPAARVRASLTQWAEILGYAGSEIFPKQARLGSTRDGKLQMGNWINLPYFNAHRTNRYAYRDGHALKLQEFLDLAEKMAVTKDQMRGLALAKHPDAPPCIQKMMANGVATGMRNEALYNAVVYLKRQDSAQAEARAVALNATMFTKPLPKAEATRTINSALRPDYTYRCGEEPVRSLCDRESCLKQKYGITPGDAEKLVESEMLPTFSDLVKYMTEPVRWEIKIDNVRVFNLGTPALLDWRMMRELIAERLTKIVPMIKAGEWERILQPLMAQARIVETPDDASVNGVVRDRLREFAAKTDLFSRGEDKEERKALLRGLPVVQVQDGERCVLFRGQDFVNYLKRTKSEELKGVNLWFAVKEIGVGHTRVRVTGKENINVWYLPVSQVLHGGESAEPPKFVSEL